MKKTVTVERQEIQHLCDICEKAIIYYGKLMNTCTECNRDMCKECSSEFWTGSYHTTRCWCKSCYETSEVFLAEREAMIKHHKQAIKALDEACHEACLALIAAGESDEE